MAKIILEFEGDLQSLQLGIVSLARSVGWQVGSEEDPLPYAKGALGSLTREKVLYYQELDSDTQTQVAVDQAVAQKESIMRQVKEGTLGALDAVTLNVRLVQDE